MTRFSALFFAAGVVSVLSAALPMQERSLPTGTVTCGSNKYSPSQVSAAVNLGYKYYKAGTQLGSDKYPHAYYSYADENISLYCSGSTWSEFPILSGGSSYSGGSPGADRVIFNTAGAYCAVVTHTGAGGNNAFTSCKGD